MKRQKGLGHAKSRLRNVLAKTTSDFHRKKEEKEGQIQSLKKDSYTLKSVFSLPRKNDKLQYQLLASRNNHVHVMKLLGITTCTRGTTAYTRVREITITLPAQVRKITWLSSWMIDKKVCLGKGVFGNYTDRAS